MNKQRAKEIASSPVMADVTYFNSNVYIDSINEHTNTAEVHFLNNPENHQQVSISSLTEN